MKRIVVFILARFASIVLIAEAMIIVKDANLIKNKIYRTYETSKQKRLYK